MDVTPNLDKMTPDEKYGVIRLLSRRLHFSAILAKQRGDDFWDRLERLADRLLRESDAIVAGGPRISDPILVEAADLLARFDNAAASGRQLRLSE
ncbi:hypothetical protein EV128_10857 [Rhizobium azibense]|nr:hypothetical protein EV128_10857 [Rhizobium azibense]